MTRPPQGKAAVVVMSVLGMGLVAATNSRGLDALRRSLFGAKGDNTPAPAPSVSLHSMPAPAERIMTS